VNVVDFVNATYLVAEGKLPTFSSGSTKWLKILGIANNKIDTWASELGGNWNSLYSPKESFGTVTNTDKYSIPDEVRTISKESADTVRIVHLDGRYTDYSVVPADELKSYDYGYYCAQIGRTLVFNHTFTAADPQYGGSIQVPVYLYASHLSADADEVPVDNPQWLVLVTAAEYNRNDLVKQNQYAPLVNEANAIMDSMKEDNSAQAEYVDTPWRPAGRTW